MMTMTNKAIRDAVINLLVDTRTFLAERDRWVQHAWATDRHGQNADIHSPAAVSWCALGGLEKTLQHQIPWTYEDRDRTVIRAAAMTWLHLAGVEIVEGWDGVDTYNDDEDRTHEDILVLYERAIALADKQRAREEFVVATPVAVEPAPEPEPEPEPELVEV
jgi:hypothetical protein